MTETTPQHNHQQQQMDIDTNMDMDMDIDVDTTPPTPNNTTATTAVTSPATSSAETSPAIHPMHAPKASSNGQKDGGAEKKGLTPLERQRLLLKQKLAAQQPAGFSSPTDNMMTPISRKLADTKKKTFATAKATSLSTRFGLAGVQAKKSSSSSSSSGSLFGEIPKGKAGKGAEGAGAKGDAEKGDGVKGSGDAEGASGAEGRGL